MKWKRFQCWQNEMNTFQLGVTPSLQIQYYQLVLILESHFIFSKYTQKIQNIWKRKAYVQLFQPESQEFQRTCAPLQWMQEETWKMCLGSLARYWMAPSDGCRLGKETSFEFGVGNTAGEGNGEGKAGVTCWGLEGSSVLFSPSLFLAKLCLCSVPLCVDFPLHLLLSDLIWTKMPQIASFAGAGCQMALNHKPICQFTSDSEKIHAEL